jgi:Ca2+-binding EF-hand superfamily protein
MAEFDSDRSGTLWYSISIGYLKKDEFTKFLAKIGVFLTTQELRSVYDNYDLNKDGKIAYGEFVSLIRENMSEKRLFTLTKYRINIVRTAFRFLDKKNEGRVCL